MSVRPSPVRIYTAHSKLTALNLGFRSWFPETSKEVPCRCISRSTGRAMKAQQGTLSTSFLAPCHPAPPPLPGQGGFTIPSCSSDQQAFRRYAWPLVAMAESEGGAPTSLKHQASLSKWGRRQFLHLCEEGLTVVLGKHLSDKGPQKRESRCCHRDLY